MNSRPYRNQMHQQAMVMSRTRTSRTRTRTPDPGRLLAVGMRDKAGR